eukprot:CAMPEP_0181503386 /NCGR_PEP_ID=MMETSP1110-20121109/56898_1 /TAXON_ID=174948 /ORGANISM="Symbiodinium sp., Strain CCMP421" /LENGTH=253 /DNA_ID=CAMNT_0023632103 /DNA_START=209 /DNA_END=971 /DNA_ORIENTATION=+
MSEVLDKLLRVGLPVQGATVDFQMRSRVRWRARAFAMTRTWKRGRKATLEAGGLGRKGASDSGPGFANRASQAWRLLKAEPKCSEAEAAPGEAGAVAGRSSDQSARGGAEHARVLIRPGLDAGLPSVQQVSWNFGNCSGPRLGSLCSSSESPSTSREVLEAPFHHNPPWAHRQWVSGGGPSRATTFLARTFQVQDEDFLQYQARQPPKAAKQSSRSQSIGPGSSLSSRRWPSHAQFVCRLFRKFFADKPDFVA